MYTRGQQAGAVSPASTSSSAAAGDSVAYPATNVASPGTKNGSGMAFSGGHDSRAAMTSCLDTRMGLTTHLSQTNMQGFRLSGNSTSGISTSRSSACVESPEKSSCIGTHVDVSTYPDDPLMIWTDTDESADEHHTRYGVSTSIRGDNGVFGASGARAGAPAVLSGAYQGASKPVFQPTYMGHPVAYSGLNGQTPVVGSDYCPGVPQIAEMPISALVVTSLSTRAHHDVPKADVRPRDHSASVQPEPRDTLLTDKRLEQYAAKERRESDKEESMLTLQRLEFNSPVRPVS